MHPQPGYIPSNDLILDSSDADMPPADALEQTTQPDASGSAAAAPATPQPGQADGAAPETPDAAKTTDDWRALLADATDPQDVLTRMARSLSRDDLLRNPVLQGIVGDAADKLERKRAADRAREAEEAAARAAREERERKLDEAAEAEDLLTLGELALEERRALKEQRQREAAATTPGDHPADLLRTQATATLNQFVDAQPPAIKTKLATLDPQRYAGLSWGDGYLKWLGDVVEIMAEARRGDWERGTRDAIRKDEIGRAEASEPDATPEIGPGGQPVESQLIPQSVWEANRTNRAWRLANHDKILRSVAAGAIHD